METDLQHLTAALYLVACVAAGLGLAIPSQRLERLAVGFLAVGAVTHGVSFFTLHSVDPTPPLTDLPAAVSFMAWIGTLFFLALLVRARLAGLVVLVAPLAFLGIFVSAFRVPVAGEPLADAIGSWPHAHVLLSSAGLALVGVAGLAGLLYLVEHRRLKAKRPFDRPILLPPLEALDRVNVASLAVGFPLLTLGVITGAIWSHGATGSYWNGTAHEIWCVVAWAVYAALAVVRLGARQGAHQAAASAVGGFAFLLFAVIGVDLLQ